MKRSPKWPRSNVGKPPGFPLRKPRPAVTLRGDAAAEAICAVVRRIPRGWGGNLWPGRHDGRHAETCPPCRPGPSAPGLRKRTSRGTASSTPRAKCRSASPAMAGTFSSDACWKRKASSSTPRTVWIWNEIAGGTELEAAYADLAGASCSQSQSGPCSRLPKEEQRKGEVL